MIALLGLVIATAPLILSRCTVQYKFVTNEL